MVGACRRGSRCSSWPRSAWSSTTRTCGRSARGTPSPRATCRWSSFTAARWASTSSGAWWRTATGPRPPGGTPGRRRARFRAGDLLARAQQGQRSHRLRLPGGGPVARRAAVPAGVARVARRQLATARDRSLGGDHGEDLGVAAGRDRHRPHVRAAPARGQPLGAPARLRVRLRHQHVGDLKPGALAARIRGGARGSRRCCSPGVAPRRDASRRWASCAP